MHLRPSVFIRSNLILISTKSGRRNAYFCSKCLKFEFRFYNIEEAKLDISFFLCLPTHNEQICSIIRSKALLLLLADYWKGRTVHTYIHTHTNTYTRTYIHTYIHTNTHTYVHTYIHIRTYINNAYIHTHIRGGADKSLARPTCRCKTESIVSLGRRVCSCAELQVFYCYRGKLGDARRFNNMETRAVIKFFFPASQGAEGNSRHSDRIIRGKCSIVYHHQKMGGPV